MMILHSYAIIDPGTMMIKSIHASFANIAVSAPWSSNDFTVWTEAVRLKLFQ